MKAPFSKKAQRIFRDRKAVSEITEVKRKGGSLHNVKITTSSGRTYNLRTSEKNAPFRNNS